ncbi:hypothetical protein FWC31_03040 [Candidatus Saccharibacteria bacterium]|nr:hypothetical protein [Candidatus Saccharibacteria bacterium]
MKHIGGITVIRARLKRFGLFLMAVILVCQIFMNVFTSSNAYGIPGLAESDSTVKKYILVDAIRNQCKLSETLSNGNAAVPVSQLINAIVIQINGGYELALFPITNNTLNVSKLVGPNDGKMSCQEALLAALPYFNKTVRDFIGDAYKAGESKDVYDAFATCPYTMGNSGPQQYNIYFKNGKWYYFDSSSVLRDLPSGDNSSSGAKSACETLINNLMLEPNNDVGVSYEKGSINTVNKLVNPSWPKWFTTGELSAADRYYFYWETLVNKTWGCGADVKSKTEPGINERKISYVDGIELVGGVAQTTDWNKLITRMPNSEAFSRYTSSSEITCENVLKRVSELAESYANWLQGKAAVEVCSSKYPQSIYDDNSETEVVNPLFTACKNGFSRNNEEYYCYSVALSGFQLSKYGSDLKNGLGTGSIVSSNQPIEGKEIIPVAAGETINACLAGQAERGGYVFNPYGGENTDPPADCYSQGGSFGWIMCPIVETMGWVINGLMDTINGQLNYQTLNDPDSSIREVWSAFIPIANIAFAIVFLIIIYSTAVGGGIGGVKQ